VRRKSRTLRAKRYLDAAGQQQTVDVFRYYCQSPACAHGSFTNLLPDLPYSPWRTEVHLQALHAYELGHGSYRRVAAGLGSRPRRHTAGSASLAVNCCRSLHCSGWCAAAGWSGWMRKGQGADQ
jgi:hypothetical protein